MGCCIRHGAASSPLPSLLQLSTLAALLFATASSASATATVSISQDGGYLNLRRCAKQCLWGTDDLLVAGLECSEPWANDCLCQTDDAAQATSFLSACCSSRCTIGGADHDITSAINEYDAYCQRNSFTVGDGDVDTALGKESSPRVLSLVTSVSIANIAPVVTSAVSISADDAYARLPDCAKACVWGDVDDLMAKGLECSDPWVNACLCREDLAGVVDAFLSQCASAKCSAAGVDTNVASARSVYENYCSRNNYDVGGGAASTPPGSQPTGTSSRTSHTDCS
jgi:hypothetical protein